ncbi:MAG: hypothetical protein D6722_01465 [Bacteroidetes bacterium]|nr:MAG: hypothetical protein D6722_01465 [Bacteroidota bacterium]
MQTSQANLSRGKRLLPFFLKQTIPENCIFFHLTYPGQGNRLTNSGKSAEIIAALIRPPLPEKAPAARLMRWLFGLGE